jgi:two-component system NtrC family response regulator
LIHHILSKLKSKVEKDTTLGDDIVEVMQSYNWPGNVRELENVLERLVVFDRKGVVTREDLPSFIRGNTRTVGKVQLQLPEEGFSLEGLERDIILEVLEMHNWNQTRTAEYLGISRNTLIYRMQKFELRKRDHGD